MKWEPGRPLVYGTKNKGTGCLLHVMLSSIDVGWTQRTPRPITRTYSQQTQGHTTWCTYFALRVCAMQRGGRLTPLILQHMSADERPDPNRARRFNLQVVSVWVCQAKQCVLCVLA